MTEGGCSVAVAVVTTMERPARVKWQPSPLAESLVGADSATVAMAVVRREPVYEKLSKTDRDEVERLIRSQFKDRSHKDAVQKIAKETLRKFVQTLYTRRGFWLNEL